MISKVKISLENFRLLRKKKLIQRRASGKHAKRRNQADEREIQHIQAFHDFPSVEWRFEIRQFCPAV